MPVQTQVAELEQLLAQGVPRDRAVLAAHLVQLRQDRGLTTYGLGKAAGVHSTYLREIEEGKRNPGLEQLLRLARALKLSSLEQLFGQLPTEDLLQHE